MSADPSRYETLDSLALSTTGAQWRAHNAKALTNMQLRLRKKEQPLWAVGFPFTDDYPEGGRAFIDLVAADTWVRIIDPIQFPKAAIVQLAALVLTFRASAKFGIQVVSRARPLDPGVHPNAVASLGIGSVGEGSPDVEDISARIRVPLIVGPEEEVSVFARVNEDPSSLSLFGASLVGIRSGVL